MTLPHLPKPLYQSHLPATRCHVKSKAGHSWIPVPVPCLGPALGSIAERCKGREHELQSFCQVSQQRPCLVCASFVGLFSHILLLLLRLRSILGHKTALQVAQLHGLFLTLPFAVSSIARNLTGRVTNRLCPKCVVSFTRTAADGQTPAKLSFEYSTCFGCCWRFFESSCHIILVLD